MRKNGSRPNRGGGKYNKGKGGGGPGSSSGLGYIQTGSGRWRGWGFFKNHSLVKTASYFVLATHLAMCLFANLSTFLIKTVNIRDSLNVFILAGSVSDP